MQDNWHLVSWNVNGWRAVWRKGAWAAAVAELEADIWCLQEIKVENPDLSLETAAAFVAGINSGERKGYSGTMILVKRTRWETEQMRFWEQLADLPAELVSDPQDRLDWELLWAEGRLCAVVWPEKKTVLLNVYFPNGGMSEARLQYKMDYYAAFLRQMQKLRLTWPQIIVCGDVNTAHQEIDLARPKENSKVTGFLPMERAWVSEVLGAGWVDTFRYFYPEQVGMYSWWDYKTRTRARNVGWRIDYFLITQNLLPQLKSAAIGTQITGSDHAPIRMEIAVN